MPRQNTDHECAQGTDRTQLGVGGRPWTERRRATLRKSQMWLAQATVIFDRLID